MKLYYYKSALGNFGDDINAWLWNDLLPGYFDQNDDVRFSGIGTIINTAMPVAKKWIVFSSGVGYGYPPKDFGGIGWDTICVRGPLSAQILGLPQDKYITDGAALLNTLSEFKPLSSDERSGTIFIPHHNALETGQWEKACKRAHITFVNPQGDAKEIIQKIRHSKLVLADAMHAAIIADAMRVPWVPLVSSSQINTFKWLDWTQTISLPYMPIVLGSSSLRESLRNKCLHLYGERYFLPGADVAASITQFKRQREIKSSYWWPRYMNTTKLLTYRIPNKVIKVLENKLDKTWDENSIDKAAICLDAAAKMDGFLSDDTIFHQNIERLQSGLKIIEERYRYSL
ncbi:polysaccharide pyruvyl transferase family protein [Sodalis sp. RH21]|uniref:polysaccharide pyruvyl transferase family protein n=1 Tax=unclassified Sodalis (in: enterobacteria) TaxID=2636512 RepID=UPI0039B42017